MLFTKCKRSCRKCSTNKDILKNFAKLKVKHLCQSCLGVRTPFKQTTSGQRPLKLDRL